MKAPSSKDMEDLYEVRCLLETLAIKTSVFLREADQAGRPFQVSQ